MFSCNKIFEIGENACLSVKMPAPDAVKGMINSMVSTGRLQQDELVPCCKTGEEYPEILSCILTDVSVKTFQTACCTKGVLPFTQIEKRGRNLYIPCKDFAIILCLQTIL